MFCLEMAQKRVSVSSPQTQNDPDNLKQAVSVGQQEVVKDKLDGDEKEKQKVHPDKFPYLLMLAENCLVLSFFCKLAFGEI